MPCNPVTHDQSPVELLPCLPRLIEAVLHTRGYLIERVGLSQPLVSWHLRRLRTAGLIQTRRAGREVICTLSRDALRRFHDDEHALLGLAS